MSALPARSRHARRNRNLLLVLAAVLLPGVLLAAPAAAHPLGNFTVNRYTGVLVSPGGVTLDHVVDLAEIPTAQLGDRLDDLPALAAQQCGQAKDDLRLEVGGTPVTLDAGRSAATTASGEGGLPITRITCRFTGEVALASAQDVAVSLVDGSAPGAVGWREITAVGDRMTLTASDVPAESLSDRLSRYPEDLLSSPPDVRTATLTVTAGGEAASLPGVESEATEAAGGGALAGRATELLGDAGVLAGLLALGLAVVLGASHALAPGHGKTVMAFYLSQRGSSSWRSALAVGATVTAAHTGSVLALGVVVLVSTQIVPAQFYPWLTLVTGLLVLALGLSLLRGARRGHGHGHGHGHGNGHGHGHGHGQHDPHPDRQPAARLVSPDRSTSPVATSSAAGIAVAAPEAPHHGHDHDHGHDHGHDLGHDHDHEPAPTQRPGRLGLWVMGLVGGLVPSPSALLLFLATVPLGRAWFGVLLVIAFGIGMATSLAVVGVVARGAVLRLEAAAQRRAVLGGPVRAFLAYGAAAGVCAVGLVIVVRTVAGLVA